MSGQGRKKRRTRKQRRTDANERGDPQSFSAEGTALGKLAAFGMERTLRNIRKTMEGKQFESLDDANAFLRTLEGKVLAQAHPQELSPKEQAQELAYQAMEAEDPATIRKLAQKALALDSDCVDALVTLARLTSQSMEAYIIALERAAEAGERSLGADFFQENKGHFWGLLETRPYMRARYELADLLRLTGRISEAIRHFEAMLELNPNDNQGVRDDLLGCYLEAGNLEGARRLFREYEEDSSAVFSWGRVLERYLSGNQEAAMRALKQARKDNAYVNGYFTGKKRLPPDLPASYSYGSEDEAVVCAERLLRAWWRHPQAVQWLKSRL